MPKLTIDGRTIEVPKNSTVLDACRALDIEIPTMCYMAEYGHFTSCMICVVMETTQELLLPACSTSAQDGMDIDTRCESVREARRTALELLLSDHVGDCDAPCTRACAAHMNIPLMIRQIAEGNVAEAIKTVKRDIALPAVLGRICSAPCERACRRAQMDGAVSICLLKRFVADHDLAQHSSFLPERAPATGKTVAVIGAGPTGLAAAMYLLTSGHACEILDENEEPGGALRTEIPDERLPRTVLNAEINAIRALGAQFHANTKLGRDMDLRELSAKHDAVILALGPLDEKKARQAGVPFAGHGIPVDAQTLQLDGLPTFAGGGAVGRAQSAVNAVADGKRMAASANQMLRGVGIVGLPRRFNSVIGKLREEEKTIFAKQADPDAPVTPAGRSADGFSEPEAASESKRCLHCDCRKLDTCKLRLYAEEYGAKQSRFKPEARRGVEDMLSTGSVVYEPGKCISCGLCVRITEKHGVTPGMGFIGRGIATRIGVPFGGSLADGLKDVADQCVHACPTGALAFRDISYAGLTPSASNAPGMERR